MEELTKRSSLSTSPFFSLFPMEPESSPPPLELFMSPPIVNWHLPSPNAFCIMISVTIERIVHSTFVPIVINLLQDTPSPLASLPNATFAIDGDILLVSAPSESAQFVINMDMWWTTVLLRHFRLNRRHTFTQAPLPLSLILSNEVLIEPGAQWYKGGNVTIFLLYHNVLLLVFSQHVHILFGMCRYHYVSLLHYSSLSFSRVYPLTCPTPILVITGRDHSMLYLLSLYLGLYLHH